MNGQIQDYRASKTFSGTGSSVAYTLTGAASADTQIINVSIGGTPIKLCVSPSNTNFKCRIWNQ